jgi:anti-sigma B factor antagonist
VTRGEFGIRGEETGGVRVALHTATRRLGDVIIVDCRGRIVFGEESAALRLLVKELLGQSAKIVLDLGEVSYMDSSGLSVLVGLYVSARNAGGALKLARLQGAVRELLGLTRLDTVIGIFPTAEAAAKSFSA